MSKRKTYDRRCRTCKGRGTIGWSTAIGGRIAYIDSGCPTCKGKRYARVRMPRRKK